VDELQAVAQYLPRILLESPTSLPRWWCGDGTLLFSDVSGFTALSEKLARHGKAGAEEMVRAISTVFTPLLAEISVHGGDVLKFGGDALLTYFDGPGHGTRAAACAHRLRRVLRSQGRVRTAYGEVALGMSQGMHSGEFHFFLCGREYTDLVVTGPGVSATLAMETAAQRGEVLLTPAAAAGIAPRHVSAGHDGGLLLANSPTTPPHEGIAALGASPAHRCHVPLALRGRLAEIVADSEHRPVTVGFLQFQGCDAVMAAAGPAVLHDHLCRIVDAVTDAASEHDVTVICIDVGADGGKFMLTCGAPDAQEKDAELMLRFGTAVLDRELPLPLRMGVNTGSAFAGRVGSPSRWTYSTMGDPVNLAARVMGKAPTRTVLATRAVLDRVDAIVDCEPVPPFAVKGKSAPVDAAIVRAVTARKDPTISALPLIGRERELRRLLAAWRDARARRPRVVELVGEAGSGKSRLAAEVTARVQPPIVVRVAGERYHRGSAYFAAHLLIRAAVGISADADPAEAGRELAAWVAEHAAELVEWIPLLAVAARADVDTRSAAVDRLAPEFRATQLRRVVRQLLTVALRDPSVLVLEDAFWFDTASAELLADLLRDPPDAPWLVLVTRRDEPTGLHHELGYAADELRLEALDVDEAVALARAAAPNALTAADAHALAAAGRGNPFFVLQMAQSWTPGQEAIPADVHGVVAARLDKLPIRSRRLLSRAAVLGTFVDLTLLEQLVEEEIDNEVLEPLLGELLLEDAPGRVRFAHDLFRTVAYEALPFRRRQELHAQAGRALEATGDPTTRAALLSVHFEAAGDHHKAWRYARVAGERARAAYAVAEAADLYARALRAARGAAPAPADVAGVAEALGDTLELVARYREAAAAYAAARRAAPAPADDVRLVRKIGMLHERESRYKAALSWYTRGLRLLSDLDEHDALEARASLLVHRAAVRYRQGRFRDAVRTALDAVSAAQDSGDAAELAHAYFLLDAALTDLQDDRAVDYRDLALPIYEELGDLVGQANVHNNIGIDAYYEGRLDDALASYERSLDCRRRAGDVVGAATAENNIGEVLSDLGRFDEAQPLFDEALAVWQRAGFRAGVARALVNQARLSIRRGQPERAEPIVVAAEQTAAEVGAEMFRFEAEVTRAEMSLGLERFDEAAQASERLLRRAPALSASPVVTATLHFIYGAAQRMTGDDVGGRWHLQLALDEFTAIGLAWDAQRTRAALGEPVVLPDVMTIRASRLVTTEHGPI
jgi:class 3 adenylate cyclase/tetratricopeptide (TPR) repeat protein